MKMLVLAAVLCAAEVGQDIPRPDPRLSRDTLIPYAISLLEREKYTEFIEQVASPEDLERVLKTRTIEDIVKTFTKEKKDLAIAALKRIEGAIPRVADGGAEAEYDVDLPGEAARTIRFVKIDKLWHIRN